MHVVAGYIELIYITLHYIYVIPIAKYQSGQERRSDHTQEQDGLAVRR